MMGSITFGMDVVSFPALQLLCSLFLSKFRGVAVKLLGPESVIVFIPVLSPPAVPSFNL